MSADLLTAASPDTDTPPTKKRKIENDIVATAGDSFGVEKGANGNGVSLSGAEHGNGANMAQNGNGVNGAENNGTAAPGEIDEGLYSRQLFVLGELKFETRVVDLSRFEIAFTEGFIVSFLLKATKPLSWALSKSSGIGWLVGIFSNFTSGDIMD